jgi:hypothetical protein
MQTNPLKDGVITENSVGLGTLSHKMLEERAGELAAMDGRSSAETSKSDREEAKQELTGGSIILPNDEALESAPESARWDPLPGSIGKKAPVSPSEDEDDEGRSDNERLVDEGIAAAEQDHKRQASWSMMNK